MQSTELPDQRGYRLPRNMKTTAPRSHQLVERARAPGPVPTAVVYPCSAPALVGALEAAAAGLILPLLVGPREQITRIALESQLDISGCVIEHATGAHASARRATEMAREGDAAMLMKGSLHTDELMTVVIARDTGLRTDRRLSHVFVMDVPAHNRLLLISDAAINIAPGLEAKRHITQNAIEVAHALGIELPRVAVLSAVETVNPAIPSSEHAAALRDMATDGRITGAIVDGPLAFDNMFSAEAALIKGISSPVSGVTDILVMPGLEAGNILYKSLVYVSGAVAAGVVVGARVPIILTSRADSAHSRIASAAVACLVARAHSKRV
ncbi:MAG: bifunctional enoyl-CoA hydratase/phosphate acetyltransferase [Burkholderiales bacterium]|nr:bifunctional enoyl-CoA hydratase/phosphate acetyltransferase [Burkholderiales bacterium]